MRSFKKIKHIIITVFIIVFLISAVAMYLNPYRGTIARNDMEYTISYDQKLGRDQALEDLKYMAERIKEHHVSAEDGLPEQVLRQYEQETAGLPGEPTVLDLWRAGSRILKQLEDAHSSVYYYTRDNWYIDIGLKYEIGRASCRERV